MKREQSSEFEIEVPGSIANLGPGFDTLAVAVELYLRLRIRKEPGTDELRFNFVNGRLDGENYIERAFRFLASQRREPFPSLSVEVDSEIPMRAGLGSSAAATVAGLRLYEAIAGKLPSQALLNVACALEHHPDNVSAALLGGLTVSCQLPDRSVFAVRLRWPERLHFVVLTPHFPLSTHASRKVLPDQISREDAVFNLQRLALLLQGLQRSDFSLLREALRDRVHQPFRSKLVPGLEQALALEHPDLLGVCLSGAGPSIVALAEKNLNGIERLLEESFRPLGVPFVIRQISAHQDADVP
ncbi:MAG: homoserine kinase [Acidobacteriaceae bacterium]|nr:homoserine kinase [Acidobacteriaceae bacterium]MBV9779957.1 homoserine kinase [Acidobacteriaceae bacterium]